ncbi:MAG TPA: histidine kinase dimerization/phosphoacceptor domain -containing protein [Crinalium sp.]
MPFNGAPGSLLNFNEAIDRYPLTTNLDASVADTIAMMSKAQSSCILPGLALSLNTVLISQARASAILVLEGKQVLGVFGEREALRAIASGRDLTTMRVIEVMRHPVVALVESEASDIFGALSLLRQHQIHHLPIIDERQQLVGMITPPGIRQVLQLDELLKSIPLADILLPSVIQAPVTTPMLDIAQTMLEHQTNSVVVSDPANGAVPVGIVSASNIVQLQGLGQPLATLPAQAVMGHPLLMFDPSELVLAAYWKMQQQKVQRFVVADASGELLSIVTPTSFLYALDLTVMQDAVDRLERSIHLFSGQGLEPPESSAQQDTSPVSESDASTESFQQLRCSRLLSGMALRIRESLDLDVILQTAVDEVRQFLQTERVLVYRFNPDMSGTIAVESVADGWQPALNSTIKDTCFGQNYAQAYQEGRIQVVEDIYTAGLTQCHIDILALYDVRASLVVPILQGEHLWGLLCAYHCSEPRHWQSFEVDLLKQLGTHMAIAIQQSELYQQVQTELTERKRAEEQLKVSLKEKESLLKEIHHRVKNNLQIISSLLRLQSDYIKDDRVMALFKESQNRIRSMALIHEKLYQSADILKIDFSEYILDLTANLLRSYTASSQPVELRVNADDIWLSIDTAIPCGLIINELVSNSLKHAFLTDSQDNEISINICLMNDNQFKLTVSDNGVGFPSDIDFQNTESLGLQLVCTFTEQLEGGIELDSSAGTSFTITFKEVGSVGRS